MKPELAWKHVEPDLIILRNKMDIVAGTKSAWFFYIPISGGLSIRIAGAEWHKVKPSEVGVVASGLFRELRHSEKKPSRIYIVRLRQNLFSIHNHADREAFRFLQGLAQHGSVKPNLKVDRKTYLQLQLILREMLKARDLQYPTKSILLKSQAFAFLALMMNDPIITKSIRTMPPIKLVPQGLERLMGELERHPERPISVQDACKIAGLSRSHFHRLFRKHAGCSFHHHLVRLRVEMASELMLETNQSIMEICFACGFGSLGRMYAAFKQFRSMAPGQLRKLNQELA